MSAKTIVGKKFSNVGVMAGRSMRHSIRAKNTIITAVIMPVLMMLFFVKVLGGSINTGPVKYVDFVTPGIILMSVSLGTAFAALRLNEDLTKGIVNRFRSMPIARSSVLTGHVLTSVVFNMLSAAVVIGVAYSIGFRAHTHLADWLALAGLLALFTTALSWLSMIFGLIANGPEGASAFSYILLLLVFVSSAFVPTKNMNHVVRAFAQHQPMTPILETTRSLLTQGTFGSEGRLALLWSGILLVVSYLIALKIYNSKAV